MDDSDFDVNGVDGGRLRGHVDALEAIEDEKQELAARAREITATAKSEGFDTKILKTIVRLRRMQDRERNEQEELLEVYKRALGME